MPSSGSAGRRRFLVCGTGHSATGWASRALTDLGLPCGHETVFDWKGDSGSKQRWASLRGDAAWPAAGWFDRLEGTERIVHLVREPLRVVRSLLGIRMFADRCDCHPEQPGVHLATPYARFMLSRLPSLQEPEDELGRAIRWVSGWTHHIAHEARLGQLEYRRCRAEDLQDPDELAQLARWLGSRATPRQAAQANRTLGTRTNTHDPVELEWREVEAHPLGEELVGHAEELGYR